jgi:hypothetical protein
MIDLGLTKEDIKAIIDKSSAKFGVVDSIKEAIYENLNNIVNSLPKKEVEGQDEIELYIKKRQKTIKNLKRKICINNNIFNDYQKIHETNIQINKEMKKMKSCFLLPSIYKLERNKVFDNIKKEIKNNFERIDKKTKSEKISPKDFKGFDDLKDKKIKSEPIKKKEDKNEIIIEEKDEIEEDKKKEIKKEEDKKEEPKKEEIKEKENETDVKKEDNKIEEVKNEIKEN